MLTLDARVVRGEDTVGEPIPADYLVLDLRSGCYIGLGEVGGFIWELLDGERDLAAVAAAVASHYEVEAERAATDVLELVTELAERGVVTVAGTAASAPPG
jgi:hypothetical protein